jgi:hypothetical protein
MMRNWTDTWFLGVQTIQYAIDFYIWEMLFHDYPDIERVVELGTAWGGLSMLLGLHALQLGADFVSYDNGDCFEHWSTDGPYAWDTPVGELFSNSFRIGDVFGEYLDEIKETVALPGRTLLVCDGGNKRLEYKTFAPLLKPGDIVTVHDWAAEIFEEDIDYDLTPQIMTDMCGVLGSLTRFFMKG